MGTNVYINNLGHMTKMVAIPIYCKNPNKSFQNRCINFKETWLMYYNVYINHDPVMTLTYLKARSTWVAYAFE